MNDYQNTSFSDVAPSHHSYEAYTPVSGRSSPSSGPQRMDAAAAAEYHTAVHPAATAAGSFHSVGMSMTPPPSATAPYFHMNMPSGMGAGPMGSMVPSPTAAAAAAEDLPSGYISTSSFPAQAPPATPDRHGSHSSSSHHGSPVSPHHHHQHQHHHQHHQHAHPHHHPMLTTSYSTDSVASMGSMTSSLSSVGGYNGPATPEEASAYPFPDVHQKQPHQHQHQHHHQQQLPLPPPPSRPSSMHSPTYVFPGHDASDVSPSEFYWQTRNESPPLQNFFEERTTTSNHTSGNLPLPPPSATLRSSVVKREALSDCGGSSSSSSSSGSSEGIDGRRYSVASSGGSSSVAYSTSSSASASAAAAAAARRSLFVDHAQLRTEALQRSLGGGEYDYEPQQPQHNPYQQAPQHHHHQPMGGYPGMIAPGMGGDIIIRNGIEVSKVASGAFKCLVAGCPARPFKRSEHLKRHVTTHHESKDLFPCEFCTRLFNRKDNWRSHLKLHTVVRGKNARTDYFPKAVRIYNEEMRKVSKSRPRKERV